MTRQDGGGGFFTGLVLGGMVGAAVGLLLAPRRGEETLEQIRVKSAELRDRGREFIEEESGTLREAVDEMREMLREAVSEGRSAFREAVAEGRDASTRTAEDLVHRFDEARESRPS